MGEFDLNKANGKEVVFYKTVSENFHFVKYVNASTTPITFGSAAHLSELANPWTGVAAGNSILSNGYDELVLVRQKQNGISLEVVGDLTTMFNLKADNIQRGGFYFGTVYQELPSVRTPVNPNDDEQSLKLDVRALKAFLENNHIPAFTFWIADIWVLGGQAPNYTISTLGREYESLLELLDLLKSSNSPIKVTALLSTRIASEGRPWVAPTVRDSDFIQSAELVPELGAGAPDDEGVLFDLGDSDPLMADREDYKAWFALLGIIGNKYPNLVGVSFDDFTQDSGVGQYFHPRQLGKMLERLREYNEVMTFLPVAYYGTEEQYLIEDANKRVLRDYTDGFTFYTRNDRDQASQWFSSVDRYNCHVNAGGQNMHGAVVLTSQAVAGGMGLDVLEIGEFRNWMDNDSKFLMQGIYATRVSRSLSLPTDFTVNAQMTSARTNANLDGVTVYKTQDPTDPCVCGTDGCPAVMGAAVYNRFASWFLVDDYFNLSATGGTPAGWTVTAAANTTCTVQPDPAYAGDKRLRFTDNSTSGAAAASKGFANQLGSVTAQWRFMQAQNRPQYMYLRKGTTFAVQIITNSNGQLYYVNPSGTNVFLQNFSTNAWYAVKVVADSSTDTFDIYVNGTLRAADAPYTVAVSGLDNIYFTTSGSTGSSSYTQYIDGVSVTR